MRETKEYRIGFNLVNERGFLSLKSMVDLMFDVSFIQADRVEKDLDMRDLAWLVYSWDIKIKSPISYKDTIKITTIPTHMKRFYAYRNFIIKRDGEEIARAHTTFLLFDRIRLRPTIISEDVLKAYGKDKEIMKEEKISKEKDFENSIKIFTRKSDIDTNGHVNNAVYFDYLREIEDFKDEEVSFIKITYKNEIRNRDFVKLSYKNLDKKMDFSLDSDGKNHAYGQVSYV